MSHQEVRIKIDKYDSVIRELGNVQKTRRIKWGTCKSGSVYTLFMKYSAEIPCHYLVHALADSRISFKFFIKKIFGFF